MSNAKIRSAEELALSGQHSVRSTVTGIPVKLHNAFVEYASASGMSKREAIMVGMMLFIRKVNGKVPPFKEKGFLKAKMNSLMEA